jgi:hypothetical protein
MSRFDGDPKTRLVPNWPKAKVMWRIGRWSADHAHIAKVCGLTVKQLRDRAANELWPEGDLSDRYVTALKSKIVADFNPKDKITKIPPSGTRYLQTVEAAIQNMADAAAAVGREHREDNARERAVFRTILERVEAYLKGEPIMIVGPDGEFQVAPFMSAKESVTDVLEKLSRISTRTQARDRVAFAMDDKKAVDPLTVKFGRDDETV